MPVPEAPEATSPPASESETTSKLTNAKLELEAKKIGLEIIELERSPWLRPVVAAPIAATAVTLALSNYLGIFDVQRQRAEVANREATILKSSLEVQIADLTLRESKLKSDKSMLEAEKTKLEGQISDLRGREARLKTEQAALETQKQQIGTEIKVARQELVKANTAKAKAFASQREAEELLAATYPAAAASVRTILSRKLDECYTFSFSGDFGGSGNLGRPSRVGGFMGDEGISSIQQCAAAAIATANSAKVLSRDELNRLQRDVAEFQSEIAQELNYAKSVVRRYIELVRSSATQFTGDSWGSVNENQVLITMWNYNLKVKELTETLGKGGAG